ncbi:hypothetical protein [Kocuria sp. NPDC057446]|uniref:hypothetical protein n=1 Tax=Kocuria sp. NPDC057446 TaxID=3346137 RepID=UPI00368F3FD8
MSASRRVTAASAAAVLGLFLAGCDNTETEETPEAPAGTTAPAEGTTTEPMEEGTTTAPPGGTGMGEEDTGADGTVPEGDTGEAETGN